MWLKQEKEAAITYDLLLTFLKFTLNLNFAKEVNFWMMEDCKLEK